MKDSFQHFSNREHRSSCSSYLMHSFLYVVFAVVGFFGFVLRWLNPNFVYNCVSKNCVHWSSCQAFDTISFITYRELLESLERKQMDIYIFLWIQRDFPMRNYRLLFSLLYLYSDRWHKTENKNSWFPWQLLENLGFFAMMLVQYLGQRWYQRDSW